MNKIKLTLTVLLFAPALAFSQNNISDFQNKLKPEYKLDLESKEVQSSGAHQKKSVDELNSELKKLKYQRSKIIDEIEIIENAGKAKNNSNYIKLQFALKHTNSQILGREKLINSKK